MDIKEDDDLIDRLVDRLADRLKKGSSELAPDSAGGEYPKEALAVGTYARSTRFNQLGVIADAFYGELDASGQKIIIYSIILLPSAEAGKYFITNEYEYEIIAYLMMNPVNLDQFTASLGRELFYEN